MLGQLGEPGLVVGAGREMFVVTDNVGTRRTERLRDGVPAEALVEKTRQREFRRRA